MQSITRKTLLPLAAALTVITSPCVMASDYADGIQQKIDRMEQVVRIDHLQEVDARILARDEALLHHYREVKHKDSATN